MGLAPEGFELKLQHLLFKRYSSGGGEAAEFAVAADDAVARDNQRQGISGKRAADGSGGVGLA